MPFKMEDTIANDDRHRARRTDEKAPRRDKPARGGAEVYNAHVAEKNERELYDGKLCGSFPYVFVLKLSRDSTDFLLYPIPRQKLTTKAALTQNPCGLNFEVTIEANKLPPLLCNMYEPLDRRTATFRVDIRLPTIAPSLSCEDFTAYTTEGVQIPCTVTSTIVNYEEIFLTS